MIVFSSEHIFIKTQDGTKMYFRMIKTAEKDFPLMTQLPLKLQWLILLSSPHQEASASLFFNAKQHSPQNALHLHL